MVERERLRQISARRDSLHQRVGNNRDSLGRGSNYIGLVGEATFADEFGFGIDDRDRPFGDRGEDFRTPFGTVDVKTARKPVFLICEEGKHAADILVLARYVDATDSAVLLGWERGRVVKLAPLRDLGYGVRSHCLSALLLRPMEELRTMFGQPLGARVDPCREIAGIWYECHGCGRERSFDGSGTPCECGVRAVVLRTASLAR